MIDSTNVTVPKESNAERPKPTVPKTPSARRPRWTPTSTLSARSSIAQPTISCEPPSATRGAGSPTPRWSRSASSRRSWAFPSDRRFLAVARRQLGHLFPVLPGQPAYFKRRRRLADTIEWLMAHFAQQSPGYGDELLLIDSTPVECARSRETVKRSALADVAGYGYCASHSRWFWGLRLHLLAAPDGTPRALRLADPRRDEREVALELLARGRRERTKPAAARIWHRSASASSRSSGPARICSRWNVTAPVPWLGCASASFRASSASRPASASTSGWDERAEPSSTTAPETAGVESII